MSACRAVDALTDAGETPGTAQVPGGRRAAPTPAEKRVEAYLTPSGIKAAKTRCFRTSPGPGA